MNLMSKNKVAAVPIAMIPARVVARPLTSTVTVYRGDHVLLVLLYLATSGGRWAASGERANNEQYAWANKIETR